MLLSFMMLVVASVNDADIHNGSILAAVVLNSSCQCMNETKVIYYVTSKTSHVQSYEHS